MIMKRDENCIFCKIISNEVPSYKVYEDQDFFGFLDNGPVMKGHMLLLPKNHSSSTLDLDDESYSKIFLKTKELSMKIRDIMSVPRVGLVVEGFGVDHTHIHLIPITSGNQIDPNKKYKPSEEELKEVQALYNF